MYRPTSRVITFVSFCSVVLLACGAIETLQAEGARRDWTQSFDGPAKKTDYAHSTQVDAAGDVFVTGMITDPANGTDIRTAKYAGGDGRLIWEKRHTATVTETFGDFGFVLRLAPDGNPIILGKAGGVYLAKYASSDGQLLWETVLPRNDDGGPEQPRALAVDGQGNVAVAAKGYGEIAYDNFSGNPYFVFDFYTAKLSGDDGQVLWSQRHAGPGKLDDVPYAIAVDGSGNVIVAGQSSGANERGNWYVAKYAAGDGQLVWEQRYSSGKSAVDVALAVAADSAGNVIVTGKAGSDLYTAKYAAADGRELWARRLTGITYGEGHALAIDAAGNAVVAGQAYSGSPSLAYVVKYDAADGRTRRERHHNVARVPLPTPCNSTAPAMSSLPARKHRSRETPISSSTNTAAAMALSFGNEATTRRTSATIP